MVGGEHFNMIAYADIKDKKTCMCSSVEIVCTKEELDLLVNKLIQFQDKIELHIKNNGQQGQGHIHYQDNNVLWKEADSDIVVYVDLGNE